MAARTTSTTCGNPTLAAGVIVALGAMVAGCQSDSAAFVQAQEAHYQKVAAWCYAYSGVTPTSELGQDCIQRAWVAVPPGECAINSCIDGSNGYNGTSRYRERMIK